MLVVFTTGIDQVDSFIFCVAASSLLHYFTLVNSMWLVAELVLTFQKLTGLFSHPSTCYLVVTSLLCWCKLEDAYNRTLQDDYYYFLFYSFAHYSCYCTSWNRQRIGHQPKIVRVTRMELVLGLGLNNLCYRGRQNCYLHLFSSCAAVSAIIALPYLEASLDLLPFWS